MKKMIHIALLGIRIWLSIPSTYVGMFVAPFLMVVVLGLGIGALNAVPDRIRVDVIDYDNSPLSARFLNNLRVANATFVLCPLDNTEDDFCALEEDSLLTEKRSGERLLDNTALALIEIPAGFEAHLQAGKPISLVYRSNETTGAGSYILQAVQNVTQRMSSALVASDVGLHVAESYVPFTDEEERLAFHQAVYVRAVELWKQSPLLMNSHQSMAQASSGHQVGFGQSIPGIATMFAMFFVFGGMINLISERQSWTFQRLVMMPITRGQILGGKILMYFLLGMMEFAIIFTMGFLLGVNFGHDPVALILVMMTFTLCVTSLTFALSTLLRTDRQGYALLNLLGLTLAPLGGAWWPLEVVPEFMRVIGHLSPVAWAMDSFRALIFENARLNDILINLVVLSLMAVGFFMIAVWRFRYE